MPLCPLRAYVRLALSCVLSVSLGIVFVLNGQGLLLMSTAADRCLLALRAGLIVVAHHFIDMLSSPIIIIMSWLSATRVNNCFSSLRNN